MGPTSRPLIFESLHSVLSLHEREGGWGGGGGGGRGANSNIISWLGGSRHPCQPNSLIYNSVAATSYNQVYGEPDTRPVCIECRVVPHLHAILRACYRSFLLSESAL